MTVSAVLRNGAVNIDGTDSDDVHYCRVVHSILMAQTMTMSAVLRNGALNIDGTDDDTVCCTAEWCTQY